MSDVFYKQELDDGWYIWRTYRTQNTGGQYIVSGPIPTEHDADNELDRLNRGGLPQLWAYKGGERLFVRYDDFRAGWVIENILSGVIVSGPYESENKANNVLWDIRAGRQKEEVDRQTILSEADKIINGERQDQYGAPENSFKIIADYWTVFLQARFPQLEDELGPEDVAEMMTLFKMARMLGQQQSRDNYLDAIGYLAIAADRLIDWGKDGG